MRNLAGRLTARSIPELTRIAEFWQTVVTGRDRHAVVGQLYRELREPRSARDAWERLDDSERKLIQLLALDDERQDASRTIPELASALGWDEHATREVAIALYRKGILYREGDDDELPIGQLPRVFLPRELTATFRRIQDEIDAGLLQSVPLPALLALLDINELEEAARLWDIEVLPGLTERAEIEGQLVDALCDEERRQQIIGSLKGDSALVWELLASAAGAIARLDDLMGAAGLAGEGVALAQRRRTAIGRLEERLLVWHTYGPDQQRMLFVPQQILATARRSIERQVAAPFAVESASVEADDWIHPWAVPWDLLTLLRAVTGSHAPRIERFEDAPGNWLEDVSARLWNGDDPDVRLGYLAFLAGMGRQESVFDSENGALSPGRAWKQWRSRSFADQYAHLVWWWNASAAWIEGGGRTGVMVSDGTLPQFRRKLLVLMAGLDPGVWYETESIGRWVAEIDPDILGQGVAIATAGALDVPAGHPRWPSHATSAVVQAALLSAFRWFNLVETGNDSEGRAVLRPTGMLRTLESTDPVTDLSPPAGPPIVLHDDLTLDLIDPSPLRVWSLSAFADQQQLRPVARYRISQASLNRALDAGAALKDVTNYLESETASELPAQVLALLQTWQGVERRIRIRLVAEIEPDVQRHRSRLETALGEAGWSVEQRESGLTVAIEPAFSERQLAALAELIGRLGFVVTKESPDSLLEDDESGGD